MGNDIFIDTHPERMRSVEEVDDALSKIDRCEREMNRKCGIVLTQNRQLGGSYEVVSREEAVNGINKPRTCEWYVKFYPRSYFEQLRERLNGNGQKAYS